MSFINKKPIERISLDLVSPDGNAYAVMALASSLMKTLDYSEGAKTEVKVEMMSGSYTHLILTFESHFGEYVDIYNAEEAGVKLDDTTGFTES